MNSLADKIKGNGYREDRHLVDMIEESEKILQLFIRDDNPSFATIIEIGQALERLKWQAQAHREAVKKRQLIAFEVSDAVEKLEKAATPAAETIVAS